VHICMYINIYMYIYIYICICLRTCIYVYIYKYIHVYIYTYAQYFWKQHSYIRVCVHASCHMWVSQVTMACPPEILSRFRKQDLEILQFGQYWRIDHIVIQKISLRYFQKIFCYKLIVYSYFGSDIDLGFTVDNISKKATPNTSESSHIYICGSRCVVVSYITQWVIYDY